MKAIIIIIIVLLVLFWLYLLCLRCRRGKMDQAYFRQWRYAHRGLHDREKGIPENSMAAFKRAAANGFGAELDVHLMKDGKLAVIHDASLLRTAGADVEIEDLTAEALEQYPLEGTEQRVPLLEGVVHLTYVRNYGAAFSFLQGQRWLFIAVFVAFTALLIWGLHKKFLPFARFELWCLAAILGGGLGNILDRVFRGYVVDMIATDFISFPVFNVADCFITCGAIGLLIHLALFNRSFWREEKKTENHHDADL